MLTGLFWFATILGVGVTVIDLLGLIGDGSGEDAGDGGEVGGAPVLSFLRGARTLVYYCLGFGPFGLAAGAFGSGFGGRLGWSLAGGAAMAVLARLFFRFQGAPGSTPSCRTRNCCWSRRPSSWRSRLAGWARCGVHFGQSVAERYARAEQADREFAVDDRVVVSQVTDQCVYVRGEDSC